MGFVFLENEFEIMLYNLAKKSKWKTFQSYRSKFFVYCRTDSQTKIIKFVQNSLATILFSLKHSLKTKLLFHEFQSTKQGQNHNFPSSGKNLNDSFQQNPGMWFIPRGKIWFFLKPNNFERHVEQNVWFACSCSLCVVLYTKLFILLIKVSYFHKMVPFYEAFRTENRAFNLRRDEESKIR